MDAQDQKELLISSDELHMQNVIAPDMWRSKGEIHDEASTQRVRKEFFKRAVESNS